MSGASAFIKGFFVADARPWVQDPHYHHAKGSRHKKKRQNQDSDSDSDTTEVPSDTESIESSTPSQLDHDKNPPRGRLVVPVNHRGHKRSVSGTSSPGGDVGAAKNKSPYEQLWDEAEKDFQTNHKTTATRYYTLEKELSQKGQFEDQKKHADKNAGFQNTLVRTKVFLNRSRKGKSPAVKKKISKFLTVLSKLSAPIGALTAADPTMIAQPAWTGACVVLQLCLNITTKEAELLGNVERVVDIIDLYSALKGRYTKAAESNTKLFTSLSKATKALFSDILYFQATAAHRLSEHVAKKALNEAFGLDQWEPLIRQIETGNTRCQQVLDNESDERFTGMIKDMRRSLEKDINQVLTNQQEPKVVKWLSDVTMEQYHFDLCAGWELFRERGRWFVDAIQKWIENEPKQPVYWLHGTYGMGKSFLVSRAIEKIQAMIQQNPNRQLAYYYFSEERGRNTPEDAIRTLLSQLAIFPDGTIAPSISALYDSKPPPNLGMKQCLKEMGSLVENQTQTIIVIDAIDECQDYGRFLRLLKDVLPKGKNSVKIMVSSKEGTGLGSVFISPTEQKLTAETNKNDIKYYIDLQVKKRDAEKIGPRLLEEYCRKCKMPNTAGSCDTCKGRTNLEEKLVELLNKKSQGMFKYVELQISLFFPPNSPSRTRKDVEDQLQKLNRVTGEPHLQLNKTWAQIMERNASGADAQKIAGKIYKWLLYSQLPMSKNALIEAVADPPGSKALGISISKLCSNIIDINDDIVHFAHPTVRDYLEAAKDKKGKKVYSWMESHKQIATTCLEILKSSAIPALFMDSFPNTALDIRMYAAAFWPIHLREVQDISEVDYHALRELTNDFLFRKTSRTGFKSWSEAWTDIHREESLRAKTKAEATAKDNVRFITQSPENYSLITSMLSSPPDPFFAACIFGLPDACQQSDIPPAERSQARNMNDELGVFLAIKSQRLDALQMLIKAKIDVTNSWQRGNNTLHWASIHGSAKMVKLLLQEGADISSINDDGATALHLAAKSAHDPIEKIVLLSDGGLDPNRSNRNGTTVLHYAVQGPAVSRTMMEKLADSSIDFKATNSAQENALHYAVQNPNYSTKAIIKLLDEIDVNAASKTGKTALGYVIDSRSSPCTKLIDLLINWKATLDVVDDDGTVLHRAVKNTKFSASLVKKLISPASINKVDRLGRTALQCSFLPCHETTATYTIRNRTKTIALMLLEAGADCTLADKNQAIVLHYFARGPILQPAGVLTEILKKGVDTAAVDNNKATALHIALRYNKLSTRADVAAIKQLIKATKNLKRVDDDGGTVLHRAIRNTATSEEILFLLIDGGVDINAKDNTGSTALHYSVQSRDPKITQFLLSKNADPKLLNSHNSTILHHTAGSVTSAKASTITLLVKEGLDVKAVNKDGRIPLHISCRHGDKNGVVALVDRFSSDILAVDKNKDTVLHFSVVNRKGGLEITKYLLGHKSKLNVNWPNKNMETPLHLAANMASAEMVELLIEKGANCLAQNKDGDTPLHYAVRRWTPSAKMISLLVDADPKVRDLANNAGETPLECAFKNRRSGDGYPSLLLKGASAAAKNDKNIRSIDVTTGDGKTALHRAAAEGWLKAIDLLIKHKAYLNSKDKNDWTPLTFACERGDDLIAKKLLEAGASVNLEAKDKTTPLHIAAFNGHYECVLLLLEKEPNIEAEDTSNRTPLWRAVAGNNERVTRLLLKNGANVNTKNPDGRTLLHRAVILGYTSVARVLVQNGARIEAKDKNNFTPLYETIKKKNIVMIDLILEHGAKSSEPDASKPRPELKRGLRDTLIHRLISTYELVVAAEKGDEKAIKRILADPRTKDLVESKNEIGKNALVSASIAGKEATVVLLIDKYHACTSSRTPQGDTALHWAAQNGHVAVIKAFLKRGADINALEHWGRTPLHHACRWNKIEAAKLLLECRDIKLNIQDKGHETPLILAARHKSKDVAELLAGNVGIDIGIATKKGETAMHWAEVNKLDGLKTALSKRSGGKS